MSRKAKTFTGNKVPRLTKFLYPFSGIFRDACYALVGSFLLQYAINSGVLSSVKDVFDAQYGVISVAMIIALVWDGINDPIMGFIVEKVHLPWGKFKPWILIGALGNAIAVVCMFLIRPGGDGWAFVGVMIAFYFLWDLFFTMNDIGYWSMLPALTSDEQERAQLTSRMTICASIGGFAMTAACMLLPTLFPTLSSANVYGILAIAISILFLASQTAVFFLCQEKERGAEQDKVSEETHLLDLFRVVRDNPQVRVSVIAMFIYYLASGVLTGGIGLNYFYLSLGYGSGRGGLVSTGISIMYVLAMIGSQALYPVLAKKLPKKKILMISFVVQLVGFAGFLFCCTPLFGNNPIAFNPIADPTTVEEMRDFFAMNIGWALGGTMFLNYVFPLIFFFGMGLMYMVTLVMFQDSIDYNEYTHGERKESVISAWRPLTVKLSSALLRGFQFLIFFVTGLTAAMTAISEAEKLHNAWVQTNTDPNAIDVDFITAVVNAKNSVSADSLRAAGILIVALLTLSIVAAWALLQFGYKITEEDHRKMVAELEARKGAAEAPETPAE